MRATNTASRWYSPVCAISNTRGQFSPSGQGGGSPMGDSSHLSGRGLFTDGRDGSHLSGRGTVHRWEGQFSPSGPKDGPPRGTVLSYGPGDIY